MVRGWFAHAIDSVVGFETAIVGFGYGFGDCNGYLGPTWRLAAGIGQYVVITKITPRRANFKLGYMPA